MLFATLVTDMMKMLLNITRKLENQTKIYLSHYNNNQINTNKKIKHMKNLKSIALALVVVFATATASAQPKVDATASTINWVKKSNRTT
jgi:hypothetical protein